MSYLIGRRIVSVGRYDGTPWRAEIYGLEVIRLGSGWHFALCCGPLFGFYIAWVSARRVGGAA